MITRLNVGGPTRHVRLLMQGLSPADFEQCLVTGQAAVEEGEGVLPIDGPVTQLDALTREISPLRDLAARRGLRDIRVAWRPQVIHSHQAKAGLLARLARGRIPAVHTFHGLTREGYFGPAKRRLFTALERLAARRSAALICQSPAQEREVLDWLGASAEGRTVVIPPALPRAVLDRPDGCETRKRLRATLGVPEGERVLLLPARLVPIKRADLAVRALAALPGTGAGHQLWIAGDGPLGSGLRSLAESLGVSGRVRFLGQRADVWDLMVASDLVFLTSRMEGTPLALLEAAALGIPVLGPDVGGVRDVLGDDAVLLPSETGGEGWAEALRDAEMHAHAWRAAADERRGRVRIAQDPERLIARVGALYRRLVSGSG